jgi:salicylate 5-hydroxylase small subunit
MIITADLERDITRLQLDYAHCLDKGDFAAWPDFFTPDAWYKLMPRENYDAGLTLSTLALHGQGMMRDRVYGVQSTIVFAPYYQRHILGPTRIVAREGDLVSAETNYLVIRTKRDLPAEILSVGVYLDKIATTADGLRLAERLCIFDNDLIPNSIICPI